MVSTDGRGEPNSEVRGHRYQKVLPRGHARGVRRGRIVFPCCQYWQSYHLFFLAPDGNEFHFEDETESMEQPEDPEEEDWTETTYPEGGWIGCAVEICLAARFAVCQASQLARKSSRRSRCAYGMHSSFMECDRHCQVN
jgi:hypothetical protein